MRLMHISDLHLGTSLYDTDITADIEHALFSEILGRIYREVSAQGRIDGLIIAGDVFDKAQPPAYAEEIYGRLLTAGITTIRCALPQTRSSCPGWTSL